MGLNKVISSLTFYGYIALVCSILAIFSKFNYVFDLLDNFRFQYFWFLLLISLCHFVIKNYKKGILFLVFSIVNFTVIFPHWGLLEKEKLHSHKIFYANINSSNEEYATTLDIITKTNADIIVLLEVTQQWEIQLKKIHEKYPYFISIPEHGNFGMALFSKKPLLDQKIHTSSNGIKSIFSKIELGNKIVNLFVVHPFPPIGYEGHQIRNTHYQELAQFINSIDSTSKIVIGDFNSAPWGYHFNLLKKEVKLKLVNAFTDTWPTIFPWGFRITLDHIFVSDKIKANKKVLKDIGSDHLPILLEF